MLTESNYHLDTSHISKSGLDLINKSPAHYYDRYLRGDKVELDTSAMKFGRACHSYVLEPGVFYNQFAVLPEIDKRTKAGKELFAEFELANQGKELITLEDFETIQRIGQEIFEHPVASELLAFGEAEKIISWKQDGVNCKAKMDWLTPEGVIVDLKTCEDASPVGFARSVAKFRYHVQAAFYQQGLNEHNITGFEKFIFIAVEKSAPFNIGIYKLDYEAIEQGELEIARNLETYRICKETNRWGGYATEVQKLSLPKYAFI